MDLDTFANIRAMEKNLARLQGIMDRGLAHVSVYDAHDTARAELIAAKIAADSTFVPPASYPRLMARIAVRKA